MVSPESYKDAAVVAYEAGMDMLSRLDLMTVKPKAILELGQGLPGISQKIHERFKEASLVVGYDVLQAAQYARKETNLPAYACLHPNSLPYQDNTFDLIFANLLISDHNDVPHLLQEWVRVLTPNGLLMVTALGLDTLKEYKACFDAKTLPYLYDMHDIGDDFIRAGLDDPVLDVSHLTLSYQDPLRLVQELRASRIWVPEVSQSDEAIASQLTASEEGTYDVTYEVISAHAFAPAESAYQQQDGSVNIPLSHLKDQLAVRK